MKRIKFGFLFLTLFGSCALIVQANWIVESEVVDDSGTAGFYNSIEIGETGRVHIAYYDVGNMDLKQASSDGTSGWSSGAIDVAGDVGSYCSVAVDASGVPHFSYYYSDTQSVPYPPYSISVGDLNYVAGVAGSPVTLNSSTGIELGQYTAIALNGSGEPRVAYHDATNGDLYYIEKTGTSWGSRQLIEGGGKGASLTLDASGNAHITHVSGTALRYAHWTGSSWQKETLTLRFFQMHTLII